MCEWKSCEQKGVHLTACNRRRRMHTNPGFSLKPFSYRQAQLIKPGRNCARMHSTSFLPISSQSHPLRGRQFLLPPSLPPFSLPRTSINRVVVDKADQRRQGLLETRDGRAPRTLPGVVGQVVHPCGRGGDAAAAACLPAGIKWVDGGREGRSRSAWVEDDGRDQRLETMPAVLA